MNMPVPIEFFNLVILRSALDEKYEGGSSAFIDEHGPFDCHVRAFDADLVKFGAMNPSDMLSSTKYVESFGLTGVIKRGDTEIWCDFCVLDELMGPTLPCDWIEYDRAIRSAAFKQS
jgi:hypothetical protein